MPSISRREDGNIWLAASDNQIDRVVAYLEEGIDVNERDQNGYSCMHAAASYGLSQSFI